MTGPGPDRAARRAEPRAEWARRLGGLSGPGRRGGTSAWAIVPLLLAAALPARADTPVAGIDAATRAEIAARTVRYMVGRHPEVAAAGELCLELPGEAAGTAERALQALGDLTAAGRALRSGAPCAEPPPAEGLRVVLDLAPVRELQDRMDVEATLSAADGKRRRFVYYLVVIAGEWTVTGYLEPRQQPE